VILSYSSVQLLFFPVSEPKSPLLSALTVSFISEYVAGSSRIVFFFFEPYLSDTCYMHMLCVLSLSATLQTGFRDCHYEIFFLLRQRS
jgi:hypothetical protein